MFALLSVIECPECGQAIPFSAMNPFGEPDMEVVQCSECGTDLQVHHSKDDELIVESLKKH